MRVQNKKILRRIGLYTAVIILLLIFIFAVMNKGVSQKVPKVSTTPSISAWIYPANPGDPACSAMQEIADGRKIDVLKPQYYTLSPTGSLVSISALTQCNGYSHQNAAFIKAHSIQQYVTISGTIQGVSALAASRTGMNSFILTIQAFLQSTGFTGAELDVEGYANWNPRQYQAYKTVVNTITDALHSTGHKLIIDTPVIINDTYQGYYPNFKYEDFQASDVDQLVVMCYDLQSDTSSGTAVATLDDITQCSNWVKVRISDPSRIVIGLNSYGYYGQTGAYTMTRQLYNQMQVMPGFESAVRDPNSDLPKSGEMMWSQNGVSYDYSDQTTLNMKLQTVLDTGLTNVSVWSLGGGNPWFTQTQPTPPSPTPTPDPLAAFTQQFPLFSAWYEVNLAPKGRRKEKE